MAVLTDANLKKFKTNIDNLQTEVNKWSQYIGDAKTQVNSSIGSQFRTDFAIGKKATENITSILDLLTTLEKDLKTLVNESNKFYSSAVKANKGTAK